MKKMFTAIALVLILVMSLTTVTAATGGPIINPSPVPPTPPNPYFGYQYTYIGTEEIGEVSYGKNDFETMTAEVSYDTINGSRFGMVNGGAYDKLPKEAKEVSLVIWVPADGIGYMDEPYRFVKININDGTKNFVVLSPSYSRLKGFSWDRAFVDIKGSNMLLKSYDKRTLNRWGSSAGTMVQLKFYVW